MRKSWILLSFLLVGMMACKITKKPSTSMEKIILEDVVVRPSPLQTLTPFQPMEPRVVDLLHTHLKLSFNYQKQWVMGEALLLLTPYNGKLTAFELDAQGFTLEKVARIKGKDTLPMPYTYDSLKLHIETPLLQASKDTLKLYIKYIAKPNEIKRGGGKAITDSKGLYFINPLGTDPNKPRQIWTQGETEFNSCWFPTIDAPNEKHTQDIFLTVDSNDVTLSNGLLIGSVNTREGKRIDHWQQLKPHAPYLTMIAIGNFIITRDTWRNKEVSYYLEPDYAPYARTIFGATPNMLETFSQITGVAYPWDKFSQVVCRDFVSGAMENTSAVLHYEGVQHTDREHLDNPHEDIIVHELFHHWFGDLVTCRSWSNLSLNESFATYGEYLYNEKTYGKEMADRHFSKNLDAYLRSKNKYQTSLVRNYYQDADEVFDVVSYQKGSWILHQLRNEVGDEAFFKGMNRYLTRNAFGTTEISDLRHAMEWACGRDLQRFFNQWYHGTGHPNLQLKTYFDAEQKIWKVEINQLQDSVFGIFPIKTRVQSVWENNSMQTQNIELNKAKVVVDLGSQGSANLVSCWMDPDGNIPGVINENNTPEGYVKQLQVACGAGQFQTALRAARAIDAFPYTGKNGIHQKATEFLLQSHKYFYQLMGLDLIEKNDTLYAAFEENILELATQSKEVELRVQAYYLLGHFGKAEKVKPVLLNGLNDSSYGVMSTCLQAIADIDKNLALEKCKEMEVIKTATIQRTLAWLYANYATDDKNAYFKGILGKYGMLNGNLLNAYANYLKKQPAQIVNQGLLNLEAYYVLNSNYNKAKVMKSLLKNLQNKSAAPEVFEGVFYNQFLERVEKDNLQN